MNIEKIRKLKEQLDHNYFHRDPYLSLTLSTLCDALLDDGNQATQEDAYCRGFKAAKEHSNQDLNAAPTVYESMKEAIYIIEDNRYAIDHVVIHWKAANSQEKEGDG